MTTRHRRAPSALPVLGLEDMNETNSHGNTQPLLNFKLPAKENIINPSFRPLNGKFSYNAPGLAYNESSKHEQESNEGSLTEQKIEIFDEIDVFIESEDDPIAELSQAIAAIIKRREVNLAEANSLKKVLKSRLFHTVKQEVFDKDRAKDNNKYSEETVEELGSSIQVDDLSLVKFESSIGNVRRRKGKTVKFKD